MDEQPQVVVTKLFGGPAETCEEKIQSHLRSLRKVLAEFLDWRASEEKRRLDYLDTSEAERCRLRAEFERLRRLLAEKEREVLGRLAELDAAFEATQVEKSLRVAEGIVRLQGLIGQLEAKRLPQDIGSILSSWSEMKLHLPSGLPVELEKSLSSCRRQRDALREALKEFGDLGSPKMKPGTRTISSAEEKEGEKCTARKTYGLHLTDPGPRPPGETSRAQPAGVKGGDYGNKFPELIIIKTAFFGIGYEYV
ncbi:zinc finger protein RFP-like isoform X2 [Nyctibius grandis]|uniref:zinc finger protein RFP-like isoform X2 n=1 Tax=Nyctibius grandis TaxID=48427 RepID=UPI0035BC4E45